MGAMSGSFIFIGCSSGTVLDENLLRYADNSTDDAALPVLIVFAMRHSEAFHDAVLMAVEKFSQANEITERAMQQEGL